MLCLNKLASLFRHSIVGYFNNMDQCSSLQIGRGFRLRFWWCIRCPIDKCKEFLLLPDSSLAGIPTREVRLIARVFFDIYSEADFEPKLGEVVGQHAEPMVGGTICKTATILATAFWDCYQWHPFHKGYQIGAKFWSNLNDFFKVMESISPNIKHQKAVTPQLLHYLASFSSSKVL